METPTTRRIPPVVLMAGALAAQRLIARRRVPARASQGGAVVVLAASAWLVGRPLLEFRRRRTTVSPVALGAGTLVTSGPNRFTRNPMYLGMAGVLLAHALSLRSPVAVLPAGVFMAVIDRVQIPAEEVALRTLFGDEYDAYVRATPRWLVPRLSARLSGAASDGLALHRPAVTRGGFSHLPRHSLATPSAEIVGDLRGER